MSYSITIGNTSVLAQNKDVPEDFFAAEYLHATSSIVTVSGDQVDYEAIKALCIELNKKLDKLTFEQRSILEHSYDITKFEDVDLD